jgi:Bacteriocin-protection, YdeI or OmpD-Associated/Domain of unknown function (DU1801)
MGVSTVDEFLAKARPFAIPIIGHWREQVRKTEPEALECIKWGMPHFTLNGKILTGMGAFKAHCSLIIEDAGQRGGEGMGHFGKITSLAEMPDDDMLVDLIRQRAARIRSGEKPQVQPKAPKAEAVMPDDFAKALGAVQGVRERFDAMAPSHRREYLEWIVEAKRPETRAKRIATACEWVAEGKKRNWKYEKC